MMRFKWSGCPPSVRRTPTMWVCAIVLACSALGGARGAALDDAQRDRLMTPAHSASTSSGLPWEGRLLRAARLRMTATLRPVADYARNGNFYGTSELVSLLERTAHAIAARWPGSQLRVGELSAPRGGKLEGHHSHRSGRDADVAFLMRDQQGKSSRFWRFVTFGSEGVAQGALGTLYFDDARNWAVVSTMLRDPGARVQYVFVAQPIRTRLLMEGRRQAESDDFLRAAAAVMVEPRERHKHDNHFHVRIYCPRDDRPQCRDSEPYWPWFDGRPPGGQHAELPLIRWRVPTVPLPSPSPPLRSPSSNL
jgi:penicillin-insensitive murein endopeptidase